MKNNIEEKDNFTLIQLIIMYILALLKDFLDVFAHSLTVNVLGVFTAGAVATLTTFLKGLQNIVGETFLGNFIIDLGDVIVTSYITVFLVGSLLVFIMMPIFIGIMLSGKSKVSIFSWVVFALTFLLELVPFINLLPGTTFLVRFLSRKTVVSKGKKALGMDNKKIV